MLLGFLFPVWAFSWVLVFFVLFVGLPFFVFGLLISGFYIQFFHELFLSEPIDMETSIRDLDAKIQR